MTSSPFATPLLLLLLALGCASSGDFPQGRIIDLTWAFDASTLYWPTEGEGFVMNFQNEGYTEKGYWYAANRFSAPEHGGTHIDAPIHFHEGRWKVDEIPLRRLIGRGVLIDVSEECALDPDHRIGIADIRAWEHRHGAVPSGSIVLFRTGFGEHWPDPKYYLGTSERGEAALPHLHFPGLDEGAARWLVVERRVRAVGIDTASIDPGQSESFRSHQVLFAANVPAFENLARLEDLPETAFHVFALPMKIRGGSGGPLRIIAIIP